MRFVFLWLCAILFSGVVYGESDRDSLKVRLGAPRLNLGAPVLLTDSIPGFSSSDWMSYIVNGMLPDWEKGIMWIRFTLTEMVTGPSVA